MNSKSNLSNSRNINTLAQSIGYSKSILCAIKGLNNFESQVSSDQSKIGEEVFLEKVEEKAEDDLIQNETFSKGLDKRKSVSCNIRTKNFPVVPIDSFKEISKKSQSLSQVDQIKYIEKSAFKSDERSLRPATSISTSSSIRSHQRRAASTVSNASSSKDKFSLAEPIPFSVCAEALYACSLGDVARLKALLKEHTGLINYAYPHCYRLTPLHIAAQSGNPAIVRFLVDQGANLNAKDDNWATPLHLAAKANKPDVMNLLRSLGADSKLSDGYGKTCASYFAAAGGNVYESSFFSKEDLSNSNQCNSNISIGNISSSFSLSQSFCRMGTLRPLRRKVNKVKDLFGYHM